MKGFTERCAFGAEAAGFAAAMKFMTRVLALVCLTAALSSPASATTNSPDGSTLKAGTGGNLTTSAGIWSFGTATGSNSVVLLNGLSAAGGSTRGRGPGTGRRFCDHLSAIIYVRNPLKKPLNS